MERNILKIIGQNLKKHRLAQNLTQEKLAEKADVHTSTIGRLEIGSINVSVAKLGQIADALNINIKDLFII